VIALRPEARTRLNAGYITCYFIGGALGSLLGTQLFQRHGWNGIVVAGVVIGAVAGGGWRSANGQRRQRLHEECVCLLCLIAGRFAPASEVCKSMWCGLPAMKPRHVQAPPTPNASSTRASCVSLNTPAW
jgi:MFS family permease